MLHLCYKQQTTNIDKFMQHSLRIANRNLLIFVHLFSFFPLKRARREIPLTQTTLKRTPGISPTAWPFLPSPATSTSSFSARKLRQPSIGTKAAIFLEFFLRRTLTHFLTAELGCLDSIPIFSVTKPLAWEAPMNGFLHLEPKSLLLKSLSAHL